ncbi:MAG: radical SAM protein [Desulfohalobium sp.]
MLPTPQLPNTSLPHAVSFSIAEQQRQKTPILPIFLPFQGCPQRCLYCAQNRQTGRSGGNLHAIYTELQKRLEQTAAAGQHLELGFFGGTFTGLPLEWMDHFLHLAKMFKSRGTVTRVRCSTRPDFVKPPLLERIANAGLDLIELGIQSFDEQVLTTSRRGYSADTAHKACLRVMRYGFALGIQLLPGLPGHTPRLWQNDAAHVLHLAPECLRIYPCLVLARTPLAKLWRQGGYTPWSLRQTVRTLAPSLTAFDQAQIALIRMGLPPEPELVDTILAGPWHPALGELVRSRAALRAVISHSQLLGPGPKTLFVPRTHMSQVVGHKKGNLPLLQKVGLPRHRILPWGRNELHLARVGHSASFGPDTITPDPF